MKIKPNSRKSTPLYPTLMAMAGAVLTGCDKQGMPGSVPFEQNPVSTDNQQLVPGKVRTSGAPEEPLRLGGKAIEQPARLGGDDLHTPAEE